MSLDYFTRIRIGIGSLIFFSVVSNFQLLFDSPKLDLSKVGHDEITLYQKRFDVIREMLPARGIVGYTGGKLNPLEYWNSDAEALRNWFLTQYTLAPVVVSITPHQKLTIVNGSSGGTDSTSSENAKGTVRDLGSGTTLYDFGDGLRVITSQ